MKKAGRVWKLAVYEEFETLLADPYASSVTVVTRGNICSSKQGVRPRAREASMYILRNLRDMVAAFFSCVTAEHPFVPNERICRDIGS